MSQAVTEKDPDLGRAAPRIDGPPPGPRGLPLLGSTHEMARDPLRFLMRLSREYGDIVRFRLPGQLIYVLNHPDAIEEAVRAEHEHLMKDGFSRELSQVLGKGLLTSEGAFWKRQRRLAQPAFHHQRVQAYGDVMVRCADRAASGLEGGGTRDIHKDMMRLTLDVVAKTLFGADVDRVAEEIGSAIETFTDRFSGLRAFVPSFLPTPANVRVSRARRRLDQIVYGLISDRRRTGDTGDLLSMLLSATTEESGAMTDEQLRDEVVTLLLAGHETTALTLSYALHLLGRHPSIEDELVREIAATLGERPATAADLPRLRYADGVIPEALRLYPPAWAIGREATSPCRIGGYQGQPGTPLWMWQWVVHRDARYFAEPESFEPRRWSGDLAKQLPRYAYFPFGGGPRLCIGNAFAMMEAVLLLVTIVRRLRLAPVDDRRLQLYPSVTLRPRHGVHMSIRRRG